MRFCCLCHSDDEEDEGRSRKPIPKWAQGAELQAALHRQFGDKRIDPDLIFPEVVSCDLEGEGRRAVPWGKYPPLLVLTVLCLFAFIAAIFNTSKKRYKKRTSSANWEKDSLTKDERVNYRRAMGFM